MNGTGCGAFGSEAPSNSPDLQPPPLNSLPKPQATNRLLATLHALPPIPTFCKGVNVLLARKEAIEEVKLLPVNDHLVPAQFDELVLGQEAEESLLMPDE